MSDISQIDLRRFGIDTEMLRLLPSPETGIKNWPPAFQAAAEALFINGFGPSQIARALNGPKVTTIHHWAEVGGWFAKRDEQTRVLAAKATAAVEGDQVEVIARHIKLLLTMQTAAMRSLVGHGGKAPVEGKSMEGVISALVMAIRTERQVLGLSDTEGQPTQNNTYVTNLVQQLNVPAEKRGEMFELMRQKFELEGKLTSLTGGPDESAQIVVEAPREALLALPEVSNAAKD